LGMREIGFGFRGRLGGGGFGGMVGGFRGGGLAFGLEAFEIVRGAVEGALGGIDAALQEREVFAAADEIEAVAVGVVAHAVGRALVVPDFGVGKGIAAEQPIGIDEGGDEKRLLGGGGLPAEEVLVGEATEFGGVFSGNDLGPGIEAGLQGVGTGGGFALGGAGTGGLLRVEAIGGDLFWSAHPPGIAGEGAGV